MAITKMQTVEEQRKRILVVEDEGLIADDIRRRLERLGYLVPAIASSGEEAIGLSHSERFDLVLMDIRLKGDMDGIAVAEQLQRDLQAPVVYLTAHADPDTVSRATLTEPFGYILKPIADGNLRCTVQIAQYKHEMERRLRISEAWLSTTLRSIGEGIVATDADGDIVFLNAVAERLIGRSAAEAKGQTLMEVLTLRDEPSGEAVCNPVYDLLPGEVRRYALLSRSGETFPVEVECFENRDDRELLGAIVALRDVRERVQWEGVAMQSQRMDAIAALAAGIAGDFHDVLSQLQSQVDDLYPCLTEEEREKAARIRQSASAAAALTSQLSALSRPDATGSAVTNVNEAIREAEDSLALCLGQGVRLETELAAKSGFLAVAGNRFLQVLYNLALHARERMPAGGSLRLETSVLDLDAAHPLARRYRAQWFVRLLVTGSNLQTDAASLAVIFEPRFPASPSAAGGRFALATAHTIVTRSGAHIQAFSEPGKGTSFEILWPCIATHQGVAGLVGRRLDHPIPNVLLVEPEDSLRRAMCTALEEDGYPVLETKTAQGAEMAAAAHRGPIALLVADCTAEPLAERLAIPAALYLSGYRHDRIPAEGILQKPFPMEDFRRRVRLLAYIMKPKPLNRSARNLRGRPACLGRSTGAHATASAHADSVRHVCTFHFVGRLSGWADAGPAHHLSLRFGVRLLRRFPAEIVSRGRSSGPSGTCVACADRLHCQHPIRSAASRREPAPGSQRRAFHNSGQFSGGARTGQSATAGAESERSRSATECNLSRRRNRLLECPEVTHEGCGHAATCTPCAVRQAALDTLRNGMSHRGYRSLGARPSPGRPRARATF